MTENNKPQNSEHTNPRVFISYSWDSPEHKLWVESFAQELRKAGIDARLDAWRDESQSIDDFMMIELERADYVLAICTPEYKRKIIDNAEGTVQTASGFEMGTAAALRRAGGKDIIPVLRAGDWTEAAPSSLISYRFYDFTLPDVSGEFEQLRDRLLGHVRRPPALGKASGPAAAPELPDIFEGGGQPAPASQTMPRAADAPRSAPPQPAAPAPSAPAASGGGKKWLWALGGAVGVIVLLMMLPTGDESAPVDVDVQGLASDSGQQEEFIDEGAADGEEDWSEFADDDIALDPAPLASASGSVDWSDAPWEYYEQPHGCYVQKQLADNCWIQLGYDATNEQFSIGLFDSNWGDIEHGKIQPVVLELDENPGTARTAEGTAYLSGPVPGVYVYFQDDAFLMGLAQRHTLSVFWDDRPYTDFWIMDADLRGSYGALEQLANCQVGVEGSE